VFLTTHALPSLVNIQLAHGVQEREDLEKEDAEGKPLKTLSFGVSEPDGCGQDMVKEIARKPMSQLLPPWSVRLQILGVLLVAGLLHFMVSGLEVASVMVLELEFGWNASRAGVITGITFLLGLPLRRLLNMAKGSGASDAKTVAVVRSLLLINALSCVLLFRWLCQALAPGKPGGVVCVGLLLIGDMLFYNSAMFAQALLRGIAMQCAQDPGEGPFDITNIVLGWAVFVDLVARPIGAPLARARLASAAGRDGYALQQLVVLVIAWACAEVLVLHHRADTAAGPGGNAGSGAPYDAVHHNGGQLNEDELKMLPRDSCSASVLSDQDSHLGDVQSGSFTIPSATVGKTHSSCRDVDPNQDS